MEEVLVFENEQNLKNSQILKFVIEKIADFTYQDLDIKFGYSNGYFAKIANGNKTLSKIHTIAIESEFNIPKNIFFNDNIKNSLDVEKLINDYKIKKICINNESPESLKRFKQFNYLYVYDRLDNPYLREYKIYFYDNLEIQLQRTDNESIGYKGFIRVSNNSIMLIIQNKITKYDILIRVLLSVLDCEHYLPFTYLGFQKQNLEHAWYGVITKEKQNKEVITNLLKNQNNNSENEIFYKSYKNFLDRLQC